MSGEVDSLFYFVVWVSAIIFVAVVAAMIYFTIKYRRRDAHERFEPLHEHKLLETAWIVIPTILVLIVFTWGFRAYVDLTVAPPDSYEITVRGKMWIWEFEYPEGFTTVGELHVPVDRPVRLVMSSEDVLHSFFIPVFRVKHDVLPNRFTSVWFQATQEGEYPIFCTEYCGTSHSGMLARIFVKSQEDFEDYLASGGGGFDQLPLPEYGEILYSQQGCQACHSLDGSRLVGPSFQGLYNAQRQFTDGSSAVADENYLRQAILEPAAQVVEGYPNSMTPIYGGLGERELSALIEFIKEQQ